MPLSLLLFLILPLNVGNEWTYSVSSNYPGCPSGKHKSTVDRMVTIAGRTAFEVQGACVGYRPGHYSVSEGTVDTHYDGRWYRAIDLPIAEGHTWIEFRTKASWTKLGSVTTPGGTFEDCWRKTRHVAYTDWIDYCFGVGAVRSKMVDLGGNWIAMELTSYALSR